MSDGPICESAAQSAPPDTYENYRLLLAWAAERHREEHIPAQIFNSMRETGWSRDDAVRALLEALPDAVHDEVRLLARPAPAPDFSASPSSVTIDGHTVRVLCEMRHPHLVVFGDLLSPDECQALKAAAEPRLQRSMTGHTGKPRLNAARTSWGMFFQRGETALLARIEARIAALLGWPGHCAEKMQVLRYTQGQQYKPHRDYFDPSQGPWAPVFRPGGQRVASLVIYLNTPSLGGSTVFPEVPIEVRAVAGNAVFFSYETPDASSRTLHGGAPVTEGEKWVAVKWFRQGTCPPDRQPR